MSSLVDDLLDAWRRHNDIHLYILDWIPPEGLAARTLLKTGKPSRGRDVAGIFAHLHAVRLDKLKRNLDDLSALPSIDDEAPDAERLGEALSKSGDAVAELVDRSIRDGEPLRGWKRSPLHWVTYLIAHESHHRGQIAQALKQSGVRPPQEVSYGVWGYWGGYELKPPST
ncbi:MAG: DinB family protein [Thermoanaerobaculia bacterium]|nr:DinB family protein [Thermoanaerobaculia bacterium]